MDYIELENYCYLEFTNNSLININNPTIDPPIESSNVPNNFYEIVSNNPLIINFKLYKVPNNCNINKPLTDLTYDFGPEYYKYNDTILIQIHLLVKFEKDPRNNEYILYLYSEEEDKNYKLYDENDNELFLNEPIKFSILKIKSFGENYTYRNIKIFFYTIDDDVVLYPKSTLSSINFTLCGYGCDCSSLDINSNY